MGVTGRVGAAPVGRCSVATGCPGAGTGNRSPQWPSEVGLPFLFVDLRDNAVYEAGRRYALSAFTRGIPAQHFRALLFLEHSLPYADP